MLPTAINQRWLGWLLGWLILGAFYLRFAGYFDPRQTPLGEDFSYFLPALLDGVYWIGRNGLFEVPWFSPAQCGGLPAFANPQNLFFSPVQWLAALVGPLAAVKAYFFLMAALGYWGMWRLARRFWSDSVVAGGLVATLFLVNGFVVERVLVGHLTYTAFYLVPLLALLSLPISERGRLPLRPLLAGVLWAATLYAGGAVVVPVMGAAVLLLGAIWSLTRGGGREFLANLLLAALVAVALGAAKLLAGWELISLFPRGDVAKPAFAGLQEALAGLGYGLFFDLDTARADALLAPGAFASKGYALSYGLTPVALLLVVVAIGWLARAVQRNQIAVRPGPALAVAALLVLALAINLEPGMLSRLPPFADLSTYLPFLSLWMLAVVMLCGAAIAALEARWQLKWGLRWVLWLIPVSVLAGSFWMSYSAPDDRRYDPTQLQTVWERYQASDGKNAPRIGQIAAYLDASGRPGFALNGNELFARGGSCLLCYEPVFGYRLDRFPVGELRLGPVTRVSPTGVLNFKRPECLLYPAANQCVPGAQFRLEERARLERFISYQPIAFRMPLRQQLANGLSLLAGGAVLGLLLLRGWRRLRRR